MDEIAAAGTRAWHSDRPAAEQGQAAGGFADLKNARKASFPVAIEPMLAHSERLLFEVTMVGRRS